MSPQNNIPPPVYPPSETPGQPPHGVPQPYQAQQTPPTLEKSDALGIVSIVFAFVGLALIGLPLGLIGAHKAKKEHRSPVLSRIGWICSLIIIFITLAAFLIVFAAAPSNIRRARDINTKNDINRLYSLLEYYNTQNGYYPPTLDELGTDANLKDEYGRAYIYTPGPAGCQRCETYLLETTLEDGTKFQYTQI